MTSGVQTSSGLPLNSFAKNPLMKRLHEGLNPSGPPTVTARVGKLASSFRIILTEVAVFRFLIQGKQTGS